jgi:hypothetical protein
MDMWKVIGALRFHAKAPITECNYFFGSLSSAIYLQQFSKKALGRAQKPMHEFVSSGCENHPTCVKRILARKIVLNILYIKVYGDSFSDAPLIPHAQTEGRNPFNILRGCGQSHNHTSSSAEYILQ